MVPRLIEKSKFETNPATDMKVAHVLRTVEYRRISGVAHLAWISDAIFLGKLVVDCTVADAKQNEVVDAIAQL